MVQPLPPFGTNIQRWGLVRIVKYPSTNRIGVARSTLGNEHVRCNVVADDWKDLIKADSGALSWGEVYKGWGLTLVEASTSTLNQIAGDSRATIRVFPQKNLTDDLTAGQITTINNWLLNMGMNQSEIDGFNLSGKSVAQIFNWLNRGVCGLSFDGVNIIETLSVNRGICRTVDEIVNEFNLIKLNPFIDPNPEVPILDTFIRADENPLRQGSNWSSLDAGARELMILNNVMEASSTFDDANSHSSAYFKNFGGEVQVALTIKNFHSFNALSQLEIHGRSLGSNPHSGYVLRFFFDLGGTETHRVHFRRRDAGTDTNLGSFTTVGVTVDDEFYANFKNNTAGTLTFYINGIQITTTTDAIYKDQTGYIGLEINRVPAPDTAQNSRFTNFKAGSKMRVFKVIRPRPFAPGLAR